MRVKVTMFVDVPNYMWNTAHLNEGSTEERTRTFHIANEIRRALGSTHPFWLTSLNNFNLTWETTRVPSK